MGRVNPATAQGIPPSALGAVVEALAVDNVFEIEDGEVVIVKFLRCVNGHSIVQRTDQITEPVDRGLGYIPILAEYSLGAERNLLNRCELRSRTQSGCSKELGSPFCAALIPAPAQDGSAEFSALQGFLSLPQLSYSIYSRTSPITVAQYRDARNQT